MSTSCDNSSMHDRMPTYCVVCFHDYLGHPNTPTRNTPDRECIDINEMIIEYLSFNGCGQSLSIFAAESHPGDAMLGDAFIRNEVGLLSSTSSLPMLYDIVEAAKARRRQK